MRCWAFQAQRCIIFWGNPCGARALRTAFETHCDYLPNNPNRQRPQKPSCALLFSAFSDAKRTCNMDNIRSILCSTSPEVYTTSQVVANAWKHGLLMVRPL